MIVIIVACLAGGILIGKLAVFSLSNITNLIITLGLFVLLFSVGIDLGCNKEALRNIREDGIKLFIVPVATVLGTGFGSSLASILLKMPLNETLAVGAGFGWYSLSGVLITQMHSVELGTVAFLSNVIREVIALISIPLISRYIGSFEAVGVAGATAMDTALPVIVKSNSPDIAIYSFISGFLLTLLVPVLVPLALGL